MNYKEKIEFMIRVIENYGVKDKKVLNAMRKVPRHLFVPSDVKEYIYDDSPLSVGYGQTISQPFTVAFMLEALELKKNNKVLEIGSASGWNAALISEIVRKVITVEIVEGLYKFAKNNLKKYKNVEIVHYDGSVGYEKESPYDRIIVTAGCPEIPKPLIDQLKVDGILVAPVGSFSQSMIKLVKKKNKIEKKDLGNFVFVPLKGKFGF